MSDLRNAVDDLTLPKRVKVIQDEEVVTVMVPPLLHQLDDAIRSSMGGTSSGATSKSASSLTNDAALYKAIQINTQVRDWCRAFGVAADRMDTALSLQRWHVAALAYEPNELAFYLRMLRGFATSIKTLLDPPRERHGDCPACGAADYWVDGVRFLHPWLVTYRVDGNLITDAQAVCRSCEKKWTAGELAEEAI
jgi:hypothetical protein